MTLLTSALTLLVMVATGLVMFRRLARLLAAGGDEIPGERDLLLLGVLPGLALVGVAVTGLAILHLVKFWVLLPLTAAIFVLLRRDARALWSGVTDGFALVVLAARQRNLFPVAAILAGAVALYLGLFLCLLPGEVVDIWVYHIPLAQSVAAHSGFVYPQIGNLLYAGQPFFLEMLHGAGMTAVDHYAVASSINLGIYFGLMLLVLSFVRRARGFQFLVICYVFVAQFSFLGSTTPMIDVPRSCLSIAAYLFAYRYACNFKRFDLVLSALLAGTAVAAKTTELMTPLIICATLAPLMVRRRQTWPHLIPAAAAFLAVAAYWYVKNWLVYGNPVFPFLFGHPGLTDAYMTGVMHEMRTPFDVADRGFSTDLLTLRGWMDFAIVLKTKFRWLLRPALFCLIGLLLPRPRRWMLPFWCALLFLIWYLIMFNSTRWAEPAILLLFVGGFLSWSFVADRVLDAWNGAGDAVENRMALRLRGTPAGRALPLALSGALVAIPAFAVLWISLGHSKPFLPGWMDRELLVTMAQSGDASAYLEQTRPGYAIYRYIGRHNLAKVFQPFDNGATIYVSAYNDGRPSDSILHYRIMPAGIAQADEFVERNQIRYFVQPAPLSAVTVERLGPDHVALANAVIAGLKPHSRFLMQDRFGNSLYEILPRAAR